MADEGAVIEDELVEVVEGDQIDEGNSEVIVDVDGIDAAEGNDDQPTTPDPRRSKRDRKPPPRAPAASSSDPKKSKKPSSAASSSASKQTPDKATGGSEDDLFLQKAVVNRIVKAALPPGIQVGKEARTALAYAGKVWISYLTAASNDFCQQGNRSTITTNDLFRALNELEFDEFQPLLKEMLSIRTADKLAKKKAGAPAST